MRIFITFLLIVIGVQGSYAQSATEDKIKELSAVKWDWMAEKNVEELAKVFHDQSKFVHMSGTWNKDEELEIIKTGSIWLRMLMYTMSWLKSLAILPFCGIALHLRQWSGKMRCRMNYRYRNI